MPVTEQNRHGHTAVGAAQVLQILQTGNRPDGLSDAAFANERVGFSTQAAQASSFNLAGRSHKIYSYVYRGTPK